jgi:hypothetical protein
VGRSPFELPFALTVVITLPTVLKAAAHGCIELSAIGNATI